MTNINLILMVLSLMVWMIVGILNYVLYRIRDEKPSVTDYCFAWGIALLFMIERVLDLWGR